MIKEINGGVTAPKGFAAVGIAAGIKKGKKDMAMIYSEAPCQVAGTFTTNVVKAAPVKWDQSVVYGGQCVHAIVANSGVANACTGEEGLGYCKKTAEKAAELFGIKPEQVLVASTGVIGAQIPIDKICAGIETMKPMLGTGEASGTLAAEAIMTTDTVKKEIAVQIELGGKTVTIGGMSKGSGMIHPNMCTMLSFVMTDAAISKKLLPKSHSAVVADTYNMISVDGDTSTNDTAVVLANGLAGNDEITEENESYQKFFEALKYVNTYLAKHMAADGEGATALFEVKVVGAKTKEDAVTLSKSVITSSLTKAAIFRTRCQLGPYPPLRNGIFRVIFDPEKVDLYFESAAGKLKIIENGVSTGYSEEEATKILSEKAVTAIADMKMGTVQATAWGCDLTYDYVKINADYRS